MKVGFVSRKQMALLDELMVKAGVSIMQMMELAGYETALLASQLAENKKVVVLCGKGNNGGDGIAAARHLHAWGFTPKLIFPFKPSVLGNASKQQFETAQRLGIKHLIFPEDREAIDSAIEKAGLLVDAFIGYNLQGNPRENFAKLIEKANASGKKVLAVDIASGLDADSGKAFEPCVKADATLALTLPKKGMRKGQGAERSGKIYVGYLGVPPEFFKKARLKPKQFNGNLVEKISQKGFKNR